MPSFDTMHWLNEIRNLLDTLDKAALDSVEGKNAWVSEKNLAQTYTYSNGAVPTPQSAP
jgi:hypothetical protein